jgi:glyoxylase-like metal-dependent hydrolase (beta-lactamase superfamily II)
MIANMAAVRIKPAQITKVIVSHFHPDHVFGIMSKAPDNTPVFPNAAIYVPNTVFKFWMDPGISLSSPKAGMACPKDFKRCFHS